MDFLYALKNKLKDNYYLLLICVLFIVINDAIILSSLITLKSESKVINNENNSDLKSETISSNEFKIDIKGEVKNPGVYEVTNEMNVNDAINLAGGLKKSATTNNINLSKKLSDEMVLIISKKQKNNANTLINTSNCNTSTINNNEINNDASISKSEVIGTTPSTDNIVKNEETNNNSCISLNKATLDELLTLNGIGKSKADAIIEYRSNNIFNEIEEIKNVPGIGDALFEKIKDKICI